VGRGDPCDALLDSYDVERRPAGHEAAWRSLHPEIFDDFDGLAAEIGLRYRSAAIAGGRRWHRRPARAASLAGAGLSTLDLFDGRLTLLTGPDGDPWRTAARRAGADVPLTVVALGTDVPDRHGRYLHDLGIEAGGAVLVRPDGHVSWRMTRTPTDAHADLTDAVARTLGHTAIRSAGAHRMPAAV
jgi:putative polyketide hydroxylase